MPDFAIFGADQKERGLWGRDVGISDRKNIISMREFDCAPSSKFENMARVVVPVK